jgi:hypothetical protein
LPRGSRILFVGNKLTVPWAWMLSVLIEGAESTAGDRDEGADYLLVSRFTYQPIPGVLEAELGRLEEVRHWRNPGLHDQTHNPRIALYRLPGGAHETQIEPCDDVSAADEVSAVLRRRERAGTSLTEFPHAELPANACVELIEMPLKGPVCAGR